MEERLAADPANEEPMDERLAADLANEEPMDERLAADLANEDAMEERYEVLQLARQLERTPRAFEEQEQHLEAVDYDIALPSRHSYLGK